MTNRYVTKFSIQYAYYTRLLDTIAYLTAQLWSVFRKTTCGRVIERSKFSIEMLQSSAQIL